VRVITYTKAQYKEKQKSKPLTDFMEGEDDGKLQGSEERRGSE